MGDSQLQSLSVHLPAPLNFSQLTLDFVQKRYLVFLVCEGVQKTVLCDVDSAFTLLGFRNAPFDKLILSLGFLETFLALWRFGAFSQRPAPLPGRRKFRNFAAVFGVAILLLD